LWGSSSALALTGLLGTERAALVLVADQAARGRVVDDLRAFAELRGTRSRDGVAAVPSPHAALWRGGAEREEEAVRAALLDRLLRGEPVWLVSTPAALAGPVPAPAALRRQLLTIAPGDVLDREALSDHLQTVGYERVEQVTGVGQWAVRGGIVDVFSPARATPVRLELAGDDVESLRAFDPTSQRSTAPVGSLVILPMGSEGPEGGALGRGGPAGSWLDYLPPDAPVVLADPVLLEPGAAEPVPAAHVGFECAALGLVVLTETELFGARRAVRRRPVYQRGSGISAFTDVAPGDLVVHVEHGIGRYGGLVTLAVDGQDADYLLLEYAEGGRLYLPVQRMAAVSKYVGTGEGAARLDKLGG